MYKGKKRLLIALVVLAFGVLLGTLAIRVVVLEEQYRSLQGSIDRMFYQNYTSLCLSIPVSENISEESLEEKNGRDTERAHICWTIYSMTSYRSVPMNDIAKTLYDLCRAHVQRDIVDVELAQLLDQLAHRDFNEEEAQQVWKVLEKRMEETGVDPYR